MYSVLDKSFTRIRVLISYNLNTAFTPSSIRNLIIPIIGSVRHYRTRRGKLAGTLVVIRRGWKRSPSITNAPLISAPSGDVGSIRKAMQMHSVLRLHVAELKFRRFEHASCLTARSAFRDWGLHRMFARTPN